MPHLSIITQEEAFTLLGHGQAKDSYSRMTKKFQESGLGWVLEAMTVRGADGQVKGYLEDRVQAWVREVGIPA